MNTVPPDHSGSVGVGAAGCDAASDQRAITPPGSRLRARRTATRNGVCSMGTRVWGVVTTTSVRMLSTRGRATFGGQRRDETDPPRRDQGLSTGIGIKIRQVEARSFLSVHPHHVPVGQDVGTTRPRQPGSPSLRPRPCPGGFLRVRHSPQRLTASASAPISVWSSPGELRSGNATSRRRVIPIRRSRRRVFLFVTGVEPPARMWPTSVATAQMAGSGDAPVPRA